MLTFHHAKSLKAVSVDLGASALPDDVVWIDALAPSAEENAFLLRVLGVEAPSLHRMLEIESSSRLYRAKDALFATIPLTRNNGSGASASVPLAFVVTSGALLTVRYEAVKSCAPDHVGAMLGDRAIQGPFGALITILETIVDEIADELEGVTAALDFHSQGIFSDLSSGDPNSRSGGDLRATLVKLGQARRLNSQIDESLLSLARMSTFIVGEAANSLPAEARARFKRLNRDVASLTGHESRLSEKIQFLLDASLGLIAVEQNDIFKILTMVSVVGIPPTLLASMYGMNFKTMPEYDWPWGYPYALAVIALSALAPLLWFKRRRWW
jgi:magnesium transporter